MGNLITDIQVKLSSVLEKIIRRHVNEEAWNWLEEKAGNIHQPTIFNSAFAAIPRKTGKLPVQCTIEEAKALNNLAPQFTINEWRVDRLSRVWLLMKLDATDKEKYFSTIENLFLTAEMNELVALYSALPVLAYPEIWIKRCAEGIRSNIGDVLQSILYENPYPAKFLPEPAWNQLILKAFFTEKSIHRIIGADERANPELANILSDYAHERWSAMRPVHPQLWRFVSRHLNEHIFPDIQRIASSENIHERQAAAMVCYETNYAPAKALLNKYPGLKKYVEGGVTWGEVGNLD